MLDDCHEFIRVLIDQLCEDLCTSDKDQPEEAIDLDTMSFQQAANFSWKQHVSKNSSFITDEFCGQLVSTLECSHCGSKRYTFDPFYDLSVPFPASESSPGVEQMERHKHSFLSRIHENTFSSCNLEDCLRTFQEPEVLADPIQCTTCKQRRESSKRLQVYRFPRVLVLHLKRFGNDRKKIRTKVEFPITDFDASTLTIDEHHPVNTPVYDLFAVCEHSGRMNMGHYTATCLGPSDSGWSGFNDNHVSQSDPSDIDKSAAYVLFYKQRS